MTLTLSPPARPCRHDPPRCRVNSDYSVDQCRVCWLSLNDPSYAVYWGVPRPHTVPCVHEGHIIEHCPAGNELLHVRDCDIHDRCTRGKGRIRSCEGCTDYQPPKAAGDIGSVRHLLYHCYPVRQNGTWQRNLDRLIPRLPLFNGRRIMAIVTEEPNATVFLDKPEAVESYIKGRGFETFRIVNSPRLREAASFVPLWSHLTDLTGGEHVAFYAQAKGVTRPFDPGTTVHRWASYAYELNLDYWLIARGLLQQYPCVGAFKKVGKGFVGSASRWHFSGAFGWFRLADVWARNWRYVDKQWWGAESWPGVHFTPDDAGAIGLDGTVPQLDLYDWHYFNTTVEPKVEEWKSRKARFRSVIGLLTSS